MFKKHCKSLHKDILGSVGLSTTEEPLGRLHRSCSMQRLPLHVLWLQLQSNGADNLWTQVFPPLSQ
jgi:hypothetical protein